LYQCSVPVPPAHTALRRQPQRLPPDPVRLAAGVQLCSSVQDIEHLEHPWIGRPALGSRGDASDAARRGRAATCRRCCFQPAPSADESLHAESVSTHLLRFDLDDISVAGLVWSGSVTAL